MTLDTWITFLKGEGHMINFLVGDPVTLFARPYIVVCRQSIECILTSSMAVLIASHDNTKMLVLHFVFYLGLIYVTWMKNTFLMFIWDLPGNIN